MVRQKCSGIRRSYLVSAGVAAVVSVFFLIFFRDDISKRKADLPLKKANS